jgi:hypothetical protein
MHLCALSDISALPFPAKRANDVIKNSFILFKIDLNKLYQILMTINYKFD